MASDDPTHPEFYCHLCGDRNVSWCASSPLWNAVMRGGDINGDEAHDGIVCLSCFALIAENAGVTSGGWRLTCRNVNVELQTTTPSGRVWDEQAWLWVDPAVSP